MNYMKIKVTHCVMIAAACLSSIAYGMEEEHKWNVEKTKTPEQVQRFHEKLVLESPLSSDDPIEVDTMQRRKELKQLLYDLLVTLPRELTDLIGEYDISDNAAAISFDKAQVACAKCVHRLIDIPTQIQGVLSLLQGGFVIATVHEENKIGLEVYDANGKIVTFFTPSLAKIHALTQLSDGKLFVAGRGNDRSDEAIKTIESYNPVSHSGGQVKDFGRGAIVCMISVGGDIKTSLVYGCNDGELVFYVPLNNYKSVLKNKGPAITALANIGKQCVVAAASADGMVSLFNCRAPKNEHALIKRFDVKNAGAFWDNNHPITVLVPLEGDGLFVGSSKSSLAQQYSLKTGEHQSTLNINNIMGVQKLSNGLWIIGFKDGTFRLFNPKTKKQVALSLKGSMQEQEAGTLPTHFTVLQQPRDWLVTAQSEEFKLWR